MSFGVGVALPASGALLPSFKSWFRITLIGGADSRACREALAAASTADGLTGFWLAGCGLAGGALAGCEAVGCALVDCPLVDCGALGCWLAGSDATRRAPHPPH